MPISLKKVNGGGGTPVGSYQDFHEWIGSDLDLNGARYLRTGYIETDTSKFDTSIWGDTNGTLFTNPITMPAATAEDDWVVATADNGTNTIVAVRGRNGQTTQMYVSTNSGTTWQTISWAIGSVRVNDIIWVNSLGLFVAVANGGIIGSSTNGTTWTTRYSTGGDGDVIGIAFGAGRLVAVTNGNKVIVSTNGTSWGYATTVPATTGNSDVAFGGGKFIISALSNQCLTSTDGNTWVIQNLNLGSNMQLIGITYGDNKWLTYTNAVVNGQAGFWQSLDGVTFTFIISARTPDPYGAKARCKFYNGFWIQHTVDGAFRSKDLSQWKRLDIISSAVPLNYNIVVYHLNKWFSFRMNYSNPTVFSTTVFSGNNTPYAGTPYLMYSYPVTNSGGVVDSRQAMNKYMRIS